MKIIIFSEKYSSNVGGSELAIEEVSKELPQHEFVLITSRLYSTLPTYEREDNMEIYRVGIGHRIDTFLFEAFGWIRGLLVNAEIGFDMIWVMMASQGGLSASLFNILTRKPLLLTLQEGDDWQNQKWYAGRDNFIYQYLLKPLYHLVFKRADYITTTSAYLQKKAESVSPKTPSSLIPNGVNAAHFSENLDSQLVRRIQSIYAGEGQKLIISTSKLIRKNALGDLIQSLIFLPDNYNLLILGNGPERKTLKKQIKRYGLKDRVSMPGMIEHTKIPEYFAAADVFARPSLSEGMGNSFIEAMSARLPVVATPVGGVLNFLEDEETGLFANVSDSKSVAQQIKRLVEDEELRSKVVNNAYNLVNEDYGWDVVAGYYNQVFAFVSPGGKGANFSQMVDPEEPA